MNANVAVVAFKDMRVWLIGSYRKGGLHSRIYSKLYCCYRTVTCTVQKVLKLTDQRGRNRQGAAPPYGWI